MLAPFLRAEAFGERVEHRAVEIHALRDRHVVHLDRHRHETGAREHIDHRTGTRAGEFEVVRFDQDKRSLRARGDWRGESIALRFGEFAQLGDNIAARLGCGDGPLAQHGNERSGVFGRSDGGGKFVHRIITAKNEQRCVATVPID